MKTTSIWEASDPQICSYPTLTGNANADVVVIGGGITGLTTAYLLSKAGKKVIVLEARSIGLGTTGNSTGNLYATVDEGLSAISEKWDQGTMKDVAASRMEAIGLIENIVREEKIGCQFVRTDFIHFSEKGDKQASDFIEKKFKAMKEAGLDVVLGEASTRPLKYKGALILKNQAQFHPLRYVRGLAMAAGPDCRIFENSAMTVYDEKQGIVTTAKGQVKANQIVMATHTPKGFMMVQTVLGPYREFGIAAELRDQGLDEGIYWSIEQPKHSIRIMHHNQKKYLMVIGDKFKTGQHLDTVAYIKGLDEFLRQRFNVGPIEQVWAGQQYRPADRLPYIGAHSDKMYYATGFSTDGLVYGSLAGKIISDDILGKSNRFAALYKASRHTPLKSAKDFVKENANNAIKYTELLPGKVDAKYLSELEPGQGKVIEVNGEKLAVYRNQENHCTAVSALCTHLACVVNWNGSEKSWDCPCHGSRFDTTGKVIEGPALKDLPQKEF